MSYHYVHNQDIDELDETHCFPSPVLVERIRFEVHDDEVAVERFRAELRRIRKERKGRTLNVDLSIEAFVTPKSYTEKA